MALDLRQLLRYVARWWWLLLLCPLLAGATAAAVGERRQIVSVPTYTASVTLLVNPARTGDVPTYSAATYQQLLLTKGVLEPVVRQLGLPFGVDVLRGMVGAAPSGDGTSANRTELLVISAFDTDPQRAATIANATAASFVGYVAAQTAALSGPSRAALDQQITDTKRQIDDIGLQLKALTEGGNAADPTVSVQIGTLQAQLGDLQGSYAQLLVAAQTMDLDAATAQAQLRVIEDADPPELANPVKQARARWPFALLGGLAFAIAAVVLVESFDDTVRGWTALAGLGGAELVGTVPRVKRLAPGPGLTFISGRPGDPAAEAVRSLRTTLELAAPAAGFTRLAVTSPNPGDGKTTLASNLAIAMAQTGLRTMLVDADLRRPNLHRVFSLPNDRGLSSLLIGASPPAWQAVARAVPAVPNLVVVPSGPVPMNPADLLSLDRLPALLAEIGGAVDALVLDTPSLAEGSDALIVAAHADGTLLVAAHGRTRVADLRAAAEQLRRGADAFVGIVVNTRPSRVRAAATAATARPAGDPPAGPPPARTLTPAAGSEA